MTSVLVKDLSLSFGAVEVLKKLDLNVEQGEFVVLLGPSGCGKSTLLNCIAGLLDVSTGQIFINGKNVTWEEPKDRGIGMVFQSYALYPQMTVEGNLSFGLKNARLPKDEIARRIARAAEILQIEPLLKRKPAALSGGQRQRVAIGRALVRDVDVFLFDEPLSNLDAKLRAELRVEIKRLHQQFDSPQEIYNKPVNRFVAGFIGSPGMNFLEGTLGEGPMFRAAGIEIPLSRYAFAAAPVSGTNVSFGIRPEHVSLNSGADWPFSTRVKVDVVEPMGSDSLVWTKLGNQNLAVRVPTERMPASGDMVEIGFDPMRASIFDTGDGLRL
jgi:multiple sugar transport system ATP-binding protein